MFGQLTKLLPATILDKNIARWQALPTVLFLTYCLAPGEVYTVLHFLTSKYHLLTWNKAEYLQLVHVLATGWIVFRAFYSISPLPDHKLIYLFRTLIVTMTTAIFIATNREHLYAGWYEFLTRNIAVCQSSSHVLSFLTMAVYCFYICEPFRIVYIVLKFRLQSTKDKLKYITKQTED